MSLFDVRRLQKLGCPLGGCHLDLGVNGDISLNCCVTSLQKYHLILILPKNYSKSFLNSGSLILFWIGAKNNPFSSTFISVSSKTFLLKFKTLSEQKYSWTRLLALMFLGILFQYGNQSFRREFYKIFLTGNRIGIWELCWVSTKVWRRSIHIRSHTIVLLYILCILLSVHHKS